MRFLYIELKKHAGLRSFLFTVLLMTVAVFLESRDSHAIPE